MSLKLVQNKRFRKLQHKRLRADSLPGKTSDGRNRRCFQWIFEGYLSWAVKGRKSQG